MSPQHCLVSIYLTTEQHVHNGIPGHYQGPGKQVLLLQNTTVMPVGGGSTSHLTGVFLFPQEIWLDGPKDFQLLVKDYVTYFKDVFQWGENVFLWTIHGAPSKAFFIQS